MARFQSIQAQPEGPGLRVRFQLDQPGVVGWQLFDPDSGAYLAEGEWSEARDTTVDLRVDLPFGDGAYRVQVAPVADRARFIQIDAHLEGARIDLHPPRVTTRARERWMQFIAALPKLFSYPFAVVMRNRKLMASMVKRDILARYRGSIGGALWTVLNPVLLMAAYFFVFGVVLRQKSAADPSRFGFVLYLLSGMLPWLAFSEAVGRAPQIIVEHRNFVKKLVFPIETLPVNIVISGVVTEAFGLAVFLALLLAARGAIPLTFAWLPAVIIPQVMFTAGLCWFLAALGVFVRDLTQIIGFLLTLWFFLTPICYVEPAPGQIPTVATRLLHLNPMYVLVRGYRAILLEHQAPQLFAVGVFWVVSAVVALGGFAWFYRLRKSFADVV